ncbi:MAG: single-stranded DNA-binding protein [Bacteroidia bacterium]|nr:single-stranded DNA-binding protein [Bacteroidia bacterium]
MSINKVILVGNVGKDPEIRYIEGGIAKARFTLATNENYTNKNGEKVTNTEWHNIVLWRNLAEVCEKYVKKGTQLYIEGRISTNSWTDKDGNKRNTVEIIGNHMQLLGSRPSAEHAVHNEEAVNENNAVAEGTDDLPF